MQTVPRSVKSRKVGTLADKQASHLDVFNADFPHERERMSQMDKYTLRDWLVGRMVIAGWTWRLVDCNTHGIAGVLINGSVEVKVEIRSSGLRLVCGQFVKEIKTKY